MTDIEKFKTIYADKISKLDGSRASPRFGDLVGIPDSVKVKKELVPLAGGQPFETLFPFKEIEIEYSDTPGSLGSGCSKEVPNKTYKIPLYKTKEEESDIAHAFQYQFSRGSDEVLTKTRMIIEALNKPGYDGWDTVLTSGSSDSMNKIFSLLVDEDTTVLLEEFTYPNVFHNCYYHGGKITKIKMNVTADRAEQGINIEYLRDLLDNFETHFPERKKKIVLYTISTGHNPTALTESYEKRKLIYEICKKHGVFIIEDDPYGYLQLPTYNKENPMDNPYESRITIDDFKTKLLTPSYVTIDDCGIVLRMETFSKVASPGFRLGFIVANKFFISRLANINNMTNRNPSGPSQAVLNNLLNELSYNYKQANPDALFIDGWINWCMKVAGEYTHRRNVLFSYLYESEAFKKDYFELLEPSCGMFATVIIKLLPAHIEVKEVHDKQERINRIKRAMDYCLCCVLEAGSVPVLGYKMTVSKEFSMERANFFRITFAKASSSEEFAKGAKGLSDGIMKFFEEYGTDKERWSLPSAGLVGM